MNYRILSWFVLVFLFSAKLVAQEEKDTSSICQCLSIVPEEASIIPLISSNKDTTTIQAIRIKLKRKATNCIPPEKLTFYIPDIYSGRAIPFLINPIESYQKDVKDSLIIQTTLYVGLKGVDTFSTDEVYVIKLAGCSIEKTKDSYFLLRVSEAGAYNPTKPFWVELGANFDLLDGLQANNMYGGVFLYKKDIRSVFSRRKLKTPNNNLAIFAGVYESKSTSQESTSELSPLIYFNPVRMAPLPTSDSVRAFVDTGKASATTIVSNTGLFFSPQIRLTKGSADKDGFNLFASLWIEMVWQKYKTVYNFRESGLADSFMISRTSLADANLYRSIGTKPSDQNRDLRTHYFGVGLPVFAKFGDANLFVNSVFGATNQLLALAALRPVTDTSIFKTTKGSGNEMLAAFKTPEKHWNAFYLFQFRLSEEKYGISFTGEIRGLILSNVKPVISLALSKKFDLTKLILYK